MRNSILITAALLLFVGSGIVHGERTGRWRLSMDREELIALLSKVSLQIGPWRGKSFNVEVGQFERAGADAFVVRRYAHESDKIQISMMLICGRTGPISVHTPDVCYGGAGYEMFGEPVRHELDLDSSGKRAQLWVATFRKQDLSGSVYLRVYWSWSTPNQNWTAPDNPRSAFAHSTALAKLYITRELLAPNEPIAHEHSDDLIRRLLAHLEEL